MANPGSAWAGHHKEGPTKKFFNNGIGGPKFPLTARWLPGLILTKIGAVKRRFKGGTRGEGVNLIWWRSPNSKRGPAFRRGLNSAAVQGGDRIKVPAFSMNRPALAGRGRTRKEENGNNPPLPPSKNNSRGIFKLAAFSGRTKGGQAAKGNRYNSAPRPGY